MAVRTPAQAVTWAKGQITSPSKDYYRLCLQFVRMAFGLGVNFPDAGTAWDQAKKKHRTSDSTEIPRGVPVFWELPSTADHVALSLGDGKCISTDATGKGKVGIVTIDSITENWGGTLLGWTEDLNGVTVWHPKPATVNITAALKARTNDKRVEALKKVIENGSKAAQNAAQKYLDALADREKANAKIDSARASLKKIEVKN